jgi:hypothetical protein
MCLFPEPDWRGSLGRCSAVRQWLRYGVGWCRFIYPRVPDMLSSPWPRRVASRARIGRLLLISSSSLTEDPVTLARGRLTI